MNTTTGNDKSTQNQPVYDVIIAGAGPVGLFLACELALAKCTVLVLEKAEDPHSSLKQLPFGMRGLSAPTIEAFYRRDLLKELTLHQRVKQSNTASSPTQGPPPQRPGGHFAGIPFNSSNIDAAQWSYRLPGATPTNLVSEMREIEAVLVQRAETLGVDIRRGIAITGFQQTEDLVRVQSAGQSFSSRWLVGCDGSRSVVRKTGGFEFAGTEPEFTGYSVQLDLADPEKLKPGRNQTATGMYFPSQPGYLVMLEFDGGAAHSAGAVTATQVQEALRRISGTDVTISTLNAVTTWTDRARQATTYRNGRVFLAGDAAHIHAPLGGQGLNLGLGDAMNLGWKLAATIRGNAPGNLLDSYDAERQPVAATVLDWSRAQVAVMKPDPAARALNAILRDVLDTRDGATYFAGRIWGVNTHYHLGGNHPLVGHSVPNFQLQEGKFIGELMHDGKAMLLDFDANTALKTLAGNYSDQIRYISGPAKDQLGLTAVLVRPDGIVAWAADKSPDYIELQKAAERWFVPNAFTGNFNACNGRPMVPQIQPKAISLNNAPPGN